MLSALAENLNQAHIALTAPIPPDLTASAPAFLPGTVQSPGKSPKPNAKFASNRYTATAKHAGRFDEPELHVADTTKRKSRGRCQYCGQENSCWYNCIICKKPMHFWSASSNAYAWPCAAHYHMRRKMNYCWADQSQQRKTDAEWECKDPAVLAVKKQVQERTATSPESETAASTGLRRRKGFSFPDDIAPNKKRK